MILRNSIKQIARTPARSVRFVVLLAVSTILISAGASLQMISHANIKKLEDSFQTIGIVEQRKSAVVQKKDWDAEKKEYIYLNKPEYDAIVPESVLDFEGADYIHKPEKRPYYEAYLPDYKIWSRNGGHQDVFLGPIIVEVEAAEDCVPDHPVKLRVNKVIYSDGNFHSEELYFCDHYNEKPEPLYQGKRYIMSLLNKPAHTEQQNAGMDQEYMPGWTVDGVQYTKDGERIEGAGQNTFYEEITDGFYEAGGGWQRWENLCTLLERAFKTVPVTPTHSTNLLMSFYKGETYIQEGKDISAQQYEDGENVCLISKTFAENNGLRVGDSMKLPLTTANYKDSPGVSEIYFNTNLNAQGELYPVFSENEYRIVGIYEVSPSTALSSAYQMGNCEIIVPWHSIRESDADNIAAVGPMMGYTTSFEIPNGTIEQYLEAWEKQGVDNVEITFYDEGYTQIKNGVDQIKKMGAILLAAGIVTVILIVLFYSHLFISRQKRRIAIERSMGMSKKQCGISIMSGILALILAGSLLGNTAGNTMSEKVAKMSVGEEFYDSAYSSGARKAQETKEAEIDYSVNRVWVFVITETGVICLACFISAIELSRLLKKETLELLGKTE